MTSTGSRQTSRKKGGKQHNTRAHPQKEKRHPAGHCASAATLRDWRARFVPCGTAPRLPAEVRSPGVAEEEPRLTVPSGTAAKSDRENGQAQDSRPRPCKREQRQPSSPHTQPELAPAKTKMS